MLEELTRIVRAAGEIILSAGAERGVREKTGPRDLVTVYDTRVQAFLQRELLASFPEAAFLGEEGFEEKVFPADEWLFIVDPIDGTTNFIQGYRNSCVSVGLMHRGRMECGVVYNPYDGECYTAQRDRGAFRNGIPIHCADRDLEHSLLIFGTALYYRDLVDQTMTLFNRAFPLVQDVRRFGSAALDLCYVAAGKAGVFFECRLCPWDYAAGSLIAAEAGCRVTQIDGSPLRFDRKCSVLVGAPTAYAGLREAFRGSAPNPNATDR